MLGTFLCRALGLPLGPDAFALLTATGTAEQRKLAALRDCSEAYLASPDPPREHGRVPTVNVTIDLAVLLGLKAGVAEIPGVGTMPSSAADYRA